MTRRALVAGGAAAAILAAVVPAVARPQPHRVGPGCDVHRRAVAHYAGGRVVAHPRGVRPVPCGVTTGFGGAESHVVATRDAVVVSPAVVPHGLLGTDVAPVPVDNDTQSNASPAGIAVTRDDGAHWRLVK